MRKLFIEARYRGRVESIHGIDALPDEVDLFCSVQFLDLLKDAKRLLEKAGRKVNVNRTGKLGPGQILGCSIPKVNGKAAVYIGDGEFHPIALAESGKPIYLLNPSTGNISRKELVNQLDRRRKAALAKFHGSGRIGILVSTKKGQNRIAQAEALKRLIDASGRHGYIFISDNIDYGQLENFNFIGCWVNTACPRIAIDDYERFNVPVINIQDVPMPQAGKK